MTVYAAVNDTGALFTILGLLTIPVLVAINGFFVASEFALVAVRKTRVQELVNAGTPRSTSLLEAVEHLDRSVAAAQLGITFASLALGLVSEPAMHDLIAPLLSSLPDSWQGPITRTLSVVLTLGMVTYLHVVFGELMPKIAALQSSERIGLLVARPTNFFAKMTRPVLRLMNGSSMIFLRWIGFKSDVQGEGVHSINELQLLIEDTEEAGLIDAESADYLMNVFALSNKKIHNVMVPWDKVMALEVSMSPEKILQAVRDGSHTRMPVYDKDPNNIIGIVNSKDLFFLFSLRGLVNLEDARYEPQFLDPDESVANALRLFRKSKHPMAIIRDRAAKIVGILTLEDVLEEIIGDIEDEHDDPGRRRALMAKSVRRTGGGFTKLPPNVPRSPKPGR